MSGVGRLLGCVRTGLSYSARRSVTDVSKAFFRLKINVGFTAGRFLRHYPDYQYDALAKKLEAFQETNPSKKIAEILVDPPYKVKHIEFKKLEDQFLLEQIDGNVLDLTELWIKYNAFKGRLSRTVFVPWPGAAQAASAVRQLVQGNGQTRLLNLLEAIAKKSAYFADLKENPTASIENVIFRIEEDIAELGFSPQARVVLTYPNPDGSGRWVRSSRSERLDIGDSGYDFENGGKYPDYTVKSLIEHQSDQILFVVDIAEGKEGTFKRQGLERSPTADLDLNYYFGPTEMIFVRLRIAGGETVAIFQIDHRLHQIEDSQVMSPSSKEIVPDLLPQDKQQRQHLLTALRSYFMEAIRAIEIINARDASRAVIQQPIDLGRGLAVAPPQAGGSLAVAGDQSESTRSQMSTTRPGRVEVGTFNIRNLPGVKSRRFVPLVILVVTQRIKLFIAKMLKRIMRFFQSQEQVKLVDFFSGRKRVKAYISYPDKIPGAVADLPWVIIPPAFGKTKETSFLLALYLQKNGFGVLRYDDTSSVGESAGEIENLTLSESTANIIAAVEYLNTTINPSSIGLVPFSLSARPAIKAAARDPRIAFMLPIVGAPNIETLLARVYGENLIKEYGEGKRKGALNLLGHIVNSNRFLGDAHQGGFAYLDSTIKDMEQLRIPIVWSCGQEDPWVDLNEVRALLEVNPGGALREIINYEGLSHRIREAGKAPELFAEVVRQIMSLVDNEPVSPERVRHPSANEIIKRAVLERSRIKRRISREEEIQLWDKYLEGFDILLETDDYMKYLNDLWKTLNLRPGENVLDAGCGNGNLTQFCLNRMALQKEIEGWKKGEFIGLDFVADALKRAEEKIREVKEKRVDLPKHRLIGLDLDKEPFPFKKGHFDKIVSSLLISYLEQPEKVVATLCGSLKKGGTIVLTSLKPDADLSQIYHRFLEKLKQDHPTDDQQELMQQARDLLNAAMGWIEVEEESGRFKYFSEAELKDILRSNGIRDIEVKRSFGDQALIVVGRKS